MSAFVPESSASDYEGAAERAAWRTGYGEGYRQAVHTCNDGWESTVAMIERARKALIAARAYIPLAASADDDKAYAARTETQKVLREIEEFFDDGDEETPEE